MTANRLEWSTLHVELVHPPQPLLLCRIGVDAKVDKVEQDLGLSATGKQTKGRKGTRSRFYQVSLRFMLDMYSSSELNLQLDAICWRREEVEKCQEHLGCVIFNEFRIMRPLLCLEGPCIGVCDGRRAGHVKRQCTNRQHEQFGVRQIEVA